MRRFYALVRLSYGVPASPAKAAELEVDWWRVHRQVQYSTVPGVTDDDLVESVTRLYCYLFGEPRAEVRPAAVHRVRAMSLSDQWVRERCLPDSPLLPADARRAGPRLRRTAGRRTSLSGSSRTRRLHAEVTGAPHRRADVITYVALGGSLGTKGRSWSPLLLTTP
jgi:hypothetical protein